MVILAWEWENATLTYSYPAARQVIERVERMAGAPLYKGTRRVDLNKAAEREAREKDATQAADSKLDLKVKIMVIGMTGEGGREEGASG